MNSPKISIIIPVYNTEIYIAKCLESTINQTYKNLEIICIDDESNDNSLSVLHQYEQKDNRIKIYTQKNSGQGICRNNGIKYATGEYIMFVDSDDWLDLSATEEIIKTFISKNAEVI